ncbi:DNA-binding protein [Bacillus megaterium]|uniref:HIRAN domain-containing protein n=1 Tax=Priestia megaterium TaxID=1404 RepID=UPI001292CEB2|nr:HIRAN domain-containing protein [Priestia megaterium]MQR87048.1 DNA-binding protein [Priestia megaterium]
MTRPYLLWLIWQNVNTRQRYHVGNLSHENGEYTFQYENNDKNRGLKEALANGYHPHIAFPDLEKVYHSNKLFGAFSRRLPSRSRPDFVNILRKYGLSKDYTEMDLLRISGGRLGTDSYEFVQPVYIHNNHFDFDFYIAGWRHHGGDVHLNSISDKTELFFEKEPDNPEDPYAVMVKTDDGVLLGYVPGFFSEFMTDVIDRKCFYEVGIDNIDPDAIPQLRVNVSVNGEFNLLLNDFSKQTKDLVPIEVF